MTYHDEDERIVPLERSERGQVLFCVTCKSDTPHSNNYACGDSSCCGRNFDYCDVCCEEYRYPSDEEIAECS